MSLTSTDNAKKAKSGYKVKEGLKKLLRYLKEENKIKGFQERYTVDDPELSGKNHYRIDYKVSFHDDSYWILHATNSVRSDRVNGIFYHVSNIRRLDKKIEKAYLVYPGNVNDIQSKAEASSLSRKIHNNEVHRMLDDVLTFARLEILIKSKQERIQSIEYEELQDPMSMLAAERGAYYAHRGNSFEEEVVTVLESKELLEFWNKKEGKNVPPLYDWYLSMLTQFGYQEDDTLEYVKATRDIPNLPSGGKPKTDIIAIVKIKNENEKAHTISCKKSTADNVSVHEYSAEAFINVLNIKEEILKDALLKFQEYGGIRTLYKNSPESVQVMNSLLKTYNKRLIEWAYFGLHGSDQWEHLVEYLVLLNKRGIFTILSREQVVREKMSEENQKQFGTPFSWTYPSKSKGKRIQLKGHF